MGGWNVEVSHPDHWGLPTWQESFFQLVGSALKSESKKSELPSLYRNCKPHQSSVRDSKLQ